MNDTDTINYNLKFANLKDHWHLEDQSFGAAAFSGRLGTTCICNSIQDSYRIEHGRYRLVGTLRGALNVATWMQANSKLFKPRKVYFYWLTRDQTAPQYFKKTLEVWLFQT